MSGVLFNSIPGSGLVAPIAAFEINSGGGYESRKRTMIVGHKTPAGSLADNTWAVCASREDAIALAGAGSQLYEMFCAAFANAPVQEFWLAPIPAVGEAQVWTVTLANLPAAGGQGVLEIAGRRLMMQVGAGEALATTAANLAAAVNAFADELTGEYLPVTASAAAAVVTLTARHAGAAFGEIEIVAPDDLPGNIFAPAGRVTVAVATPGTGTPSLSTLLGAVGDEPFDWFILPVNDSSARAAAAAFFSDVSGRWAWNRQVYGHGVMIETGNLAALTTYGLSLNDWHLSTIGRIASPTPSWEWLAAMTARLLPWLTDDTNGNVARNHTGLEVERVRPPRRGTPLFGYSARNTLNRSGISTWHVNAASKVCIDKFVTMRRLGSQGQPDTALRDIQAPAQIMAGIPYIRAYLQDRHSQKARADRNPFGLAAISTPDDIRIDTIAAYGETVRRGIFENAEEFARRLVVETDKTNPNRVNLGLKLDRVNPLDILAANATIYAQYPAR